MEINIQLLRRKQRQKLLSNVELANSIDVDQSTLYRKINGKSDFYRSEMIKLKSVLGLTDKEVIEIFLS